MDMMKMLPYSPLIPLVESHVAIYKIYILRNPLKDNEIFYVGQTFKALEQRLAGHIAETGANREKIRYIKEIIDAGSKPTIEAVEVLRGICYIDKMLVNERELYWIRYYLTMGCKLLNLSGTSIGAKCHEYHGYLSALKNGETKWHYYYCGKTAGGYGVYDEEKLKADGFKFPEPVPPPKIEKDDSFPYNPLENIKYRLKMGLPIVDRRKTKEIITEVFPVQPEWSPQFQAGLIYSDSDEFDFWHEFDEDTCDIEDEELENDESDYEPDVWHEEDLEDEPEESDDNYDYFLGTA